MSVQGRYGINFVLLDKNNVEKVHEIYKNKIPSICKIIETHIKENKDVYMSLPYLNHKVSLSLILWQNIPDIVYSFSNAVETYLREQCFAGIKEVVRPFSVFGYVDTSGLCLKISI